MSDYYVCELVKDSDAWRMLRSHGLEPSNISAEVSDLGYKIVRSDVVFPWPDGFKFAEWVSLVIHSKSARVNTAENEWRTRAIDAEKREWELIERAEDAEAKLARIKAAWNNETGWREFAEEAYRILNEKNGDKA